MESDAKSVLRGIEPLTDAELEIVHSEVADALEIGWDVDFASRHEIERLLATIEADRSRFAAYLKLANKL